LHKTCSSSKLGLALGSGAARGLAHIGVLKTLAEAGITPDLIAGTSMGAFIGALYAADVPIHRIEETALGIDWKRLTRLLDPVIPTSGLIDGKKMLAFMAELLPVRTFEELSLPLAVTATDIETGEAIIIKQGDLLEALRAGLAFPGIFSPARFGSRFLVDGGLCHPVPIDVARNLGADRVIGVCAIPEVNKQIPEAFLPFRQDQHLRAKPLRELFTAGGIEQVVRRVLWQPEASSNAIEETSRKIPNIFRVCAQSVAIMENEINQLRLERNTRDLVIRPQLDGITLLEFHRAAEIIAAGEAAALAALPAIRDLLKDD
jgi:NTE family protein